MKSNGIVIYKGKSQLQASNFSKKDIVVIATGMQKKSKNPKTGNMKQVFILREDISPVRSWINRKDFCVCGDCKHKKNQTCYVNRFQAPNNVFRAYKRNRYDSLNKDNIKLFDGSYVRFGSFGEPVSVPINVFKKILPRIKGFTAYTHQWKNPKFQEYKQFCMASVDSVKEYNEAKKLGWRTFRVRTDDMEVLNNEIICPASDEGHKKTTCEKCNLCCGNTKKAKDIVIISHGRMKKRLNALLKRIE